MENKERKNNENNNIKVLGWVAFFGGLSQDMIVPILPTFYTQILGLSKERSSPNFCVKIPLVKTWCFYHHRLAYYTASDSLGGKDTLSPGFACP